MPKTARSTVKSHALKAKTSAVKSSALKAGKATKSAIPKGWIMAGANPVEFDAFVDSSTSHSGTQCALLTHNQNISGNSAWGTLMQSFSPEKYLEKRLRMAVWIKTADIEGSVNAWMRVDGLERGKMLAFDNMCNRPIKNVKQWKEYSVVLDVPKEATNIAFGVYLVGKGRAWLDDFSLTTVGSTTPVTECSCSPNRKGVRDPQNLDFESDR